MFNIIAKIFGDMITILGIVIEAIKKLLGVATFLCIVILILFCFPYGLFVLIREEIWPLLYDVEIGSLLKFFKILLGGVLGAFAVGCIFFLILEVFGIEIELSGSYVSDVCPECGEKMALWDWSPSGNYAAYICDCWRRREVVNEKEEGKEGA